MTELPQGWATIMIGEASGVGGLSTDGDWIESKDQDPTGSVRLIQLQDIGDGTFVNKSSRFLTEEKAEELNCTFLSPGDVLIARMPDPLGRACRLPDIGQKSVTAVDVHVWRKGEHGVEPDFLVYCVNSPEIRQSLQAQASGTTRQRVSGGRLKAQEIPLPPLPEQRRIVRKLDTLSARSTTARTHLTAIEKLVERYRLGFIRELFAQLAESHPQSSLSSACLSVTDGDHQAPPKAETGVPFITISAMNVGEIDLSKATRYVPASYFEQLKSERRPQVGDVLYSVTGSIGIPAPVLSPDPFVFQRHIAIIRPDPSQMRSDYLRFVLMSPQIFDQAESCATGTAQLTIPLRGLRAFSFPLPSIDEQREIVRRIETAFAKIDRLAAEAAKALKLLGHLDQRILAKAFAGDLVPQDPTDEPAGALLARLREARAAEPKGRKRRAIAPKRNEHSE